MKDKFLLADGMPDVAAIEEWAEVYYQGLIRMMNGFYARADMSEVLASMKNIPFDDFVAKELTGASGRVIEIARDIIRDIADREIEYIKSYVNKENL